MLGLAVGAMLVVRISQKHKMKFILLVVLIALVTCTIFAADVTSLAARAFHAIHAYHHYVLADSSECCLGLSIGFILST